MSTPPELRQLASNLVARADADLAAAEACAGQTVDEIAAFHARQAVEKALKSVLAAFGVSPPQTQDLLALRGIEHAGRR